MTRRDFYWDAIAEYMDDEIRERVHMELAPCTNEEFLKRYEELHPGFTVAAEEMFGGDLEEEMEREPWQEAWEEEA